jgi:uncharacterized membrane protein YhaH (DUF805 family)
MLNHARFARRTAQGYALGCPASINVRLGNPAEAISPKEKAMGSFSIWHWLIVVIIVVSMVVPAWRIVSKAGFPGALSLLMLVPFVNIILYWVFAFIKWPVEKSSP